MRQLFYLVLALPGMVLFGFVAPALAAPKVVVSIAPIQSLVAQVMLNVGEPALLIPSNQSPHAYALRPSAARALAQADLVFWVGPEFELFLINPIQSLAANARSVALARNSALKRIPLEKNSQENQQAGELFDMHLWLDPSNAQVMLAQIAQVLAQNDPPNAATYLANAREAARNVGQTVSEIQMLLAPVRTEKFVFYHDAYRYFEQAFSLQSAATLVGNPELKPGARRIAQIRRLIIDQNISCVFSEPQFSPAIIQTLTQGTGARAVVLDPLGADIQPGPTLYGELLTRMAQNMANCLTP